jgi:hypothetical protein
MLLAWIVLPWPFAVLAFGQRRRWEMVLGCTASTILIVLDLFFLPIIVWEIPSAIITDQDHNFQLEALKQIDANTKVCKYQVLWKSSQVQRRETRVFPGLVWISDEEFGRYWNNPL